MNKRSFLAALAFAGLAFAVSAFTITPMTVSITPTAPGNLANFKVENESGVPIAVVIRVVTRVVDDEGKEKNEAATKDFTVFPARIVVQPTSTQVVKVQWKGSASPASELSYRVIAEQVPVDFSRDQTSGVKVLFRYLASLYVAPRGIVAKPVLESVSGQIRGGIPGLVVRIKNDGTRHALLFNPVLKITTPQRQQIELSGKDLEAIEGNNVLAKSVRNFFVPWPSATAGAVYEGTFSASIE